MSKGDEKYWRSKGWKREKEVVQEAARAMGMEPTAYQLRDEVGWCDSKGMHHDFLPVAPALRAEGKKGGGHD